MVFLITSSCGGRVPRPSVAKLRILAVPENTKVYIDDVFAGSARVLAIKPKSMSPGIRYITFTAPGHFPHDLRVKLPPGTTTVRMKLKPIPP